jgi:hypothetical protein
VKDDRAALLVLAHQRRVLEVLDQSGLQFPSGQQRQQQQKALHRNYRKEQKRQRNICLWQRERERERTCLALNPGVGNSTDLLGVEFLPLTAIEFLEEVHNRHRVDEVDERVADITLVLRP